MRNEIKFILNVFKASKTIKGLKDFLITNPEIFLKILKARIFLFIEGAIYDWGKIGILKDVMTAEAFFWYQNFSKKNPEKFTFLINDIDELDFLTVESDELAYFIYIYDLKNLNRRYYKNDFYNDLTEDEQMQLNEIIKAIEFWNSKHFKAILKDVFETILDI